MSDPALIQLRNINKSYLLGRSVIHAATDVTLEIRRGELVALAGPFGSGKTTLLNIIGCIDKPDSGSVIIDSIDVTAIPLHRLAEVRRESIDVLATAPRPHARGSQGHRPRPDLTRSSCSRDAEACRPPRALNGRN